MVFTGTVVSGDIPVDLTIGSGTYAEWNLIGNPYPSYISFKELYDVIADVDYSGTPAVGAGSVLDDTDAIYGYNSDTSIWTLWDLNNTSYDTDKIAPGQGFFVKSKDESDFNFTNAMRTSGDTQDFITAYRIASSAAIAKLNLTTSANDVYTTNLFFREGNTRGLDKGYDSASFGLGSTGVGIYTNLVEDNNGLELYNQALPYNDFNDVVVPLGIKANAGEQITISLDDTSTIPTSNYVYLEDNVTNTWTLLNDSDYTITPSTNLTGTGRFFVHFSTSTLSAEENVFSGLQIYMDQPSRVVRVKGQLAADTKAIIYDIQGRQVLEQLLSNDTTNNSIHVNSLNTGIYLVQLNNRTQNRTQKVIIR